MLICTPKAIIIKTMCFGEVIVTESKRFDLREDEPLLVVISGPSGVGKDTMIEIRGCIALTCQSTSKVGGVASNRAMTDERGCLDIETQSSTIVRSSVVGESAGVDMEPPACVA